MRFVHSFWSKPTFSHNKTSTDHRSKGGWLNKKFYLYSWALSALKVIEQNGEIELVTDQLGKQILINELRIPYTKISLELDCLSRYPADFWAIGKLWSYLIQTKPFLHIDSDVFFWSKLPPLLSKARLVAQNIEYNHAYYLEAIKQLGESIQLPDFVQNIDLKNINSSNAGIIGGNDVAFFKTFSKASIDFIDKNLNELIRLPNPGLLNVVFEQLFFHHIAQRDKIPITYLFNQSDPHRDHLIEFHLVPSHQKFIHVIGKDFKKNPLIASKLEMLLLHEYPRFYYRIQSIINEKLI